MGDHVHANCRRVHTDKNAIAAILLKLPSCRHQRKDVCDHVILQLTARKDVCFVARRRRL